MGADAVRLGRTGLLIHWQKSGNDYKKCVYAGQRQACVDTWTNCLVLRLSLQSGNETNDPLKSGPAKAGLARLMTPPLTYMYSLRTKGSFIVMKYS